VNRSDYPWGIDLSDNDFVSITPSFTGEVYLNLYEERSILSTNPEVGSLKYYIYDPVAHGADPKGIYPIILWLHGKNNGLAGKLAIPQVGAERFASPEYQAAMGGAYIICPIANEYVDKDGQTIGDWMTPTANGATSIYASTLKQIIDAELLAIGGNAGKVVIAGTSAGGYGAFRYIIDYMDSVDASFLMAPAYTPTEEDLNKLDQSGIRIWYVIGYRDEILKFDVFTRPILDRLLRMYNAEVTVLDWVRNGDYGIASAVYGIEMGQHCVCIVVGNNLIYDDGTPYNISHSDGVTGWIKGLSKK
jgi:predicted esterase